MKKQIATLLVVVGSTLAGSAVSYAQVRDAASKALGNYAHGESGSYSGRVIYARPAPQTSAPSPIAGRSDASGTRAFSPDVTNESRAADTQSAQRRSQRVFSYQPGTVVPRQSYTAPRELRSGVRDAGSKVRGEY